jgi:hypothetical protein
MDWDRHVIVTNTPRTVPKIQERQSKALDEQEPTDLDNELQQIVDKSVVKNSEPEYRIQLGLKIRLWTMWEFMKMIYAPNDDSEATEVFIDMKQLLEPYHQFVKLKVVASDIWLIRYANQDRHLKTIVSNKKRIPQGKRIVPASMTAIADSLPVSTTDKTPTKMRTTDRSIIPMLPLPSPDAIKPTDNKAQDETRSSTTQVPSTPPNEVAPSTGKRTGTPSRRTLFCLGIRNIENDEIWQKCIIKWKAFLMRMPLTVCKGDYLTVGLDELRQSLIYGYQAIVTRSEQLNLRSNRKRKKTSQKKDD